MPATRRFVVTRSTIELMATIALALALAVASAGCGSRIDAAEDPLPKELRARVDKLVRDVNAAPTTNETIGAVTVSFGVAVYAPGETVSQMVARADECLYMSKRNGRNRVTLETALPPLSASNAA